MLFIIWMVFLLGCETGTRYDKNATKQSVPKNEPQSAVIEHNNLEALFDDKEEKEALYKDESIDAKSWIDPEVIKEDRSLDEWVNSFSNTVVKNGLEVIKIREGKHEGYIRLVFDVYDNGQPAKSIGRYDAKHLNSEKDISIILHAYQKFSASLPSFSHESVIEQIYLEQYLKNKGLKFHIKLRQNAKVKIFELKNPARLVFDIKPI